MNVVFSLAVHPTREIIALGCANSSIKIWDILKQVFVGILSHEGGGGVVAVVFSPCGNYLAAANSRTTHSLHTISMWAIDFSRTPSTTEAHGFNQSDLRFRFLCSDTQLSVRIPNCSVQITRDASISVIPSGDSGKPKTDVNPLLHQDDITVLAFQPPLMDREVQMQLQIRAQKQAALEQQKRLKEIRKKGKAVTDLLLRRQTPTGGDDSSSDEEDNEPLQLGGTCRALASGSKDETVRFWNFGWALEKAEKKRILDEAKYKRLQQEEKEVPTLVPGSKPQSSASLQQSSLSGDDPISQKTFRKRLKLSRLEEEQRERFIWRQHKAPVTTLTFSSDAQFMITASMDGMIVVWKVSSDEIEDDEERDESDDEQKNQKDNKSNEKKKTPISGKKGEKQEKLLQKTKTVGNKSFYEPAFKFPAGEIVYAASIFPHFTMKGQVKEYYVAVGSESSLFLFRLHQITHGPSASHFPALLDSMTSDDKLRRRHLKNSWAWQNFVAADQERKKLDAEEAIRQEKLRKQKKRRRRRDKNKKVEDEEEENTEDTKQLKRKIFGKFFEEKRQIQRIKKKNITPRQKTGLLFDATPNYVQLTMVRRESVPSPVTCLGTTYLFHRDFLSSPIKDTSVDTQKKDTISTCVELNGLEESRSLLIVSGHKNKQLVAWILDYELTGEIDFRQLTIMKEEKMKEQEEKEGTRKETTTTTTTTTSLFPPLPLQKKHKIQFEDNLRPMKAVIGSTEAEMTALQIGNILMSQWLAETSMLTSPPKKTSLIGGDDEMNERKHGKNKKNPIVLGEVEKFKKNLAKRIIYRYYVFVGSSDSKVGMYTMNIKAKKNDRCLYLYRFRPKPSLPLHVDYIWKGETQKESLADFTEEPLHSTPKLYLTSKRTEEEDDPFKLVGKSEARMERKESTSEVKEEELEESNFVTLNSLAKSESEDVYLHSTKAKQATLSKLHHFQQLAAPDYQTTLNTSSHSFQDQDSTGSLTGYQREVRGGSMTSNSRMCTVDTCLIT